MARCIVCVFALHFFAAQSIAADQAAMEKALAIVHRENANLAARALTMRSRTAAQSDTNEKALLSSIQSRAAFVPEQPLNTDADSIAPTNAQNRRYFDQQINAPFRTNVRSGATSDDNRHSEFSSRAQSSKALAKYNERKYQAEIDLHRAALHLQSQLSVHARRMSVLDTRMKAAAGDQLLEMQEELSDRTAEVADAEAQFHAASDAVASVAAPAQPVQEQGFLSVGSLGRAAVITDTGRMSTALSSGAFIPSNIPVRGQPFYHAPTQTTMQGSGGLFTLTAGTSTTGTSKLVGNTVFALTSDPTSGTTTIATQQAYLQYDWLMAGVAETSFADTDALPETIDLAGPNARVTVYQNGVASGQARATAILWSPEDAGAGSTFMVSIEQPNPEISALADPLTLPPKTPVYSNNYSRIPDLIANWKYVGGNGTGQDFDETQHLHASALLRDLGREFPFSTGTQDIYGWGLSLSGHQKLEVNPDLQTRDKAYFSVTGGEGIGRYINDLHLQGNDAAFNDNGRLAAIPAIAGYVAYTHNWTDSWRSTATYSRVNMSSMHSQGGLAYRSGEYVGVNLLNHVPLNAQVKGSQQLVDGFYWGAEYLYGDHTTANHAYANMHQVMFVVSFNANQKALK